VVVKRGGIEKGVKSQEKGFTPYKRNGGGKKAQVGREKRGQQEPLKFNRNTGRPSTPESPRKRLGNGVEEIAGWTATNEKRKRERIKGGGKETAISGT